jgi:hypothetical protein
MRRELYYLLYSYKSAIYILKQMAQAAAAQQQEMRRELEALRKEAEADKRRHAEAHQASLASLIP